MDIRAYIESGMIESYVLRLTSPEETAEIESMIATYPEIAAAVEAFELKLEAQLLAEATAPPQKVKEKLFESLKDEWNEVASISHLEQPAAVVSMEKRPSIWKYVAAASIVMLLGSGWLNLHYYSKYNEAKTSYNNLLADRDALLAKSEANQTRAEGAEKDMHLMMDVAVKKVVMMSPDQHKMATVYWNGSSKEVYIAKNALPGVPAGKQYQLWALVNGKPVNAGMLNECGQTLCKMLDIAQADAFAITLEKEGGSPTPDLEQLQVLGKI